MISRLSVRKRDGKIVPFDISRIIRAIALASYATKNIGNNPHDESYGLTQAEFAEVKSLAHSVEANIIGQFGTCAEPSVEAVQQHVELCLLRAGRYEIAHHFISYRLEHSLLRPVKYEENGLKTYIGFRYSRLSEKHGRRELWHETVSRAFDMHLNRFSSRLTIDLEAIKQEMVANNEISEETARDMGSFLNFYEELDKAATAVKNREILPSMRSLQFGGIAIETHEARMYNCSASPADRVDFFREYFYLLLAGCGAGFSVQRHHVAMLPVLAKRPGKEIQLKVQHHVVEDTIEGWANALHELFKSHLAGYKVEFSYHLIRARGDILRTSGGTAPGHIPLRNALNAVEKILSGAAGRHLRPIEVYDICMHTARAVLSGGIRRSATICLFSPDDDEMMGAKTGNWYDENPQRSASNNSAVIIRGVTPRETYDKLFKTQTEFGEPGFFFVNESDPNVLTNPCCEIALKPAVTVTTPIIEKLRNYGYTGPLEEGMVLSGWQMCNLTTIAGAKAKNEADLMRLARTASFVGTCQADYTNIPYLGPVTRVINEREALIGVSLCGILDNPELFLNPDLLRRGAEVVKATNAVVAKALGISRAARTTCVKPEGTASLVLDCGSGIHPHHARRYFRRVQANTADLIYQAFRDTNPHMCEPHITDEATDVITFPVEAPENAILKADITAVRFLEMVRLVQTNWVMNGRAVATYTDAHHNVSNTVTLCADEYDQTRDFIWDNQSYFTGVSLLTEDGVTRYKQAPRETVETPDQIRKWNSLEYTSVPYQKVFGEGHTAGSEHRGAAVACSGGKCELV